MGDYATTTSISELLPWVLKSNTTSADAAGTAQFSRHITRAEGLINGYLAARYVLPFSAVPPIIRTIAEDISSYFFIRGSYVQDGQRKNEYVDAFKEALGQLKDIRDGKTPLADTSGTLIPQITSSKFLSTTKSYAPTFNDDDPMQWDTDPDKLSEIEGDR